MLVKQVLRTIYFSVLGFPIVRHVRRLRIVSSYLSPRIRIARAWIFKHSEESNFYYEVTTLNRNYLAATIAAVTGASTNLILEYFSEIESDNLLRRHLELGLKTYQRNLIIELNYGRRIVWYAFARAIKPQLIVETGVDHGVGSCILSAAILRNRAEGFPGRYLGTEINPLAGKLFSGIYAEAGEIIYQDSLITLRNLEEAISLFINDSDHSDDYEKLEYEAIKDKLSKSSIILGDNSHVSKKLFEFSIENDRSFVFAPEVPRNHWYPGAGIGISFRPSL